MGISTLISTATASGASTVSITSGIDSTYDEYMFVLTDLNPTIQDSPTFQFNAVGESGYNEEITSTAINTNHSETGTLDVIVYAASNDQAQGTVGQRFMAGIGTAADNSGVAILHLFSPSSTTYVKHFYSRTSAHYGAATTSTTFVAGYINTTAAIDDIQFKFADGEFDGVIQMYGIA
jgi:hypothetical protein